MKRVYGQYELIPFGAPLKDIDAYVQRAISKATNFLVGKPFDRVISVQILIKKFSSEETGELLQSVGWKCEVEE